MSKTEQVVLVKFRDLVIGDTFAVPPYYTNSQEWVKLNNDDRQNCKLRNGSLISYAMPDQDFVLLLEAGVVVVE